MKRSWLRSPIPDPFVLLAVFLLIGYLLASRSFAHLGIRPLYIGEVGLAAFLVARPNSILKRWAFSLVEHSRLSAFSWWLAISIAYAFLQSLAVILGGPFSMQTAEIAAFFVYPLWLFVGVWLGLQVPDFLSRAIVPMAWLHGCYGIAYVTFLAPEVVAHEYHEATQVDWFSVPEGCAILVLGLLAFERNPRRAALPMILNVIVMVGMQRRAEWLAFAFAALAWAIVSGHMRRIMLYGMVLMIPLLIGLIPGVRFPSPSIRGEDVSTYDLIGRAISVIDPSSAAGLTENADAHAATASWRSDFWAGIWDAVHSSPMRAAFGLGFDFPLWSLHADDLTDSPVRTPHSIFMFVLGYSGWVGILIFTGLQLAVGRMMWCAYRATGEAYGFCLWLLCISWAMFDPLLETPFGAIPIYLLMGISVAQAITADADPARRKVARSGTALDEATLRRPFPRRPGLRPT